ncbi:MAG: pseudaminic acid cytidylyltransferase [Bacteroidota bacterium]
MKALAIIPARGGSKRIPEKNIKSFVGKPIISYSIETALNSRLFDEVMVSTDSEKIAAVAKQYGARVPFMRSAANSNDHATIFDTVAEIIDRYKTEGKYPEIVCCFFATAPFVREEILKVGFEKVKSGDFDSAFTVQRFSYPIFRALRQNQSGEMSMFWPEHLNTRSQDLPGAFHDAGQVYFAKTEALLRDQTFFTRKAFGIIMNHEDALDIDTEEDWDFAEKLFVLRRTAPNRK